MEPKRPPLSALLSHLLVAFIIEFDNEFERRMPHRTSGQGGAPGVPWLVSMAMWANFLRFVPDEGITARELHRLLGIDKQTMKHWLTRLSKWWRYLAIEKTPAGLVVRPTTVGRQALAIWRPLEGIIEERWRERFGAPEMDDLRQALHALICKLKIQPPDFLPILGYGLYSHSAARGEAKGSSGLTALLSKVLLPWAIEFESESDVSLPICANVLRLAGDEGVRVRDLPALSGGVERSHRHGAGLP